MLVSYIITVKNGEDYILSAITSIQRQIGVTTEIIVVDDGSSDNTVPILKSIVDSLVLIETTGIGRSAALNLGIKCAKGTYICILDADDQIHPEKTKSQYQVISGNDSCDVVFTGFSVFTEDKELEDIKRQRLTSLVVTTPDLNILYYRNPFCHSSMFIKKELIMSIGGYNESLKKLVDYEIYLRLSEKKINIKYIDQKLTYKRFHANQQFESKKRLSYISSIFMLQVRFNIKNAKYLYLPFICGKFLYSLLPRNIRKKIKNSH